MSNFRITHNDKLLSLLRQHSSEIVYLPNVGNLELQLDLSSPLFISEVNNNNGAKHSYNSFRVVVDNKVEIETVVNYNAFAHYELVKQQAETRLYSIYQTTLENDEVFANNPSREIFLEPSLLPSFDNPEAISVDPSLSTAATAEYKGIFPAFVNFNFPAPIGTKNHLRDALLEQRVYYGIIEFLYRNNPDILTYETPTGTSEIGTYNIDNFISAIPAQFTDATVTHIGDYNQTYYDESFDQIERIMLNNNLGMLAKDNSPSYKSLIADDVLVSNQIICYRINKYKQGSSSAIQTFFVPAIDGYRNFIDTQVIIGNGYTYEVFAITAVYGLDYEYSTAMQPYSTIANILISSETKTLRILSIPILQKTIKVTSHAPTRPDISFLNRSNQDKTIRLYFEPNKHETREEFVLIEESDKESQDAAATDINNKIKFKNSEQILTYEIYKLNQRPNSYNEFAGNLHATVPNTTPANSEVYEMRLAPNNKFYFMFRSKNEFGLVSNPSDVYEVELIKDSDETRISVKTVDFVKDDSQATRSFGKFMKIYPAFEQVVINEFSSLGEVNQELFKMNNKQFYVGDSESPVWGRKFKLRVRSRNTGKIVDLNVDFVLNKVESEEDFT